MAINESERNYPDIFTTLCQGGLRAIVIVYAKDATGRIHSS